MNTNSLRPFAHRYLKSGIESICTRCFLIVAKEHREADLERFEHGHICDPVMMRRFEAISQPVSTRTVWQGP
ncbi:MAG TPA: hypothetical protein VGI45_16935 [Terracidiphilus sp.]